MLGGWGGVGIYIYINIYIYMDHGRPYMPREKELVPKQIGGDRPNSYPQSRVPDGTLTGNFGIKPGTGNRVRLTGNRLELEPAWTGTNWNRGMNRNRSVSIRNITAHLINDKNTSIAETCIVFIGASAGNNPRRIYWSYEFLFFRPWDFGPGGRQERTRMSKSGIPKVWPHDSM